MTSRERELEKALRALLRFATNDPTRYESRNPYTRLVVVGAIQALGDTVASYDPDKA